MTHFRRQGDCNLFPISAKEQKIVKQKGKVLKSNGSYIMARGEATGSKHELTVHEKEKLIVREYQGKMYYEVLAPAIATHTHDHEPITIEPDFYVFVAERELDHFANSIVRRVVD